MDGFGQFCPVAKAAEVLTPRWTPLVLRELMFGNTRFNEIQRGVPLMSRALLAQRLRELEAVGVVLRGEDGEYRLTEAGRALHPIVEAFGEWGLTWGTAHLTPEDMDPGFVMWSVRRRIHWASVPERRVVLRFSFRGMPPRYRARGAWWLVLEAGTTDLCLKDPGHPVELEVRADVSGFARCWLGHATWAETLRAGSVAVEGPDAMVRALPGWLCIEGKGKGARPMIRVPA